MYSGVKIGLGESLSVDKTVDERRTMEAAKPRFFKRFSLRSKRKLRKKVVKEPRKPRVVILQNKNSCDSRDRVPLKEVEHQLSEKDELYKGQLRKLQLALAHQQANVNRTMQMCLESEMKIEEKKKKILKLEMEMMSLKGDFVRERELWSKQKFFDCSDSEEEEKANSLFSTLESPTKQPSKYPSDPIREYLDVFVFK